MERNKRFLMLLKIYSVCYNNRLVPSHRQTTFEKIIAGNMCHSWMDEMHELFKGWHYLWIIQRQCAIEYVSCGNLYMCMFQCYLCFNDNHSFRDLWWSNVTPRYTKSSTIYISFFSKSWAQGKIITKASTNSYWSITEAATVDESHQAHWRSWRWELP